MDKLVTSSPMTLQWLRKLVAKMKERNPSLAYNEGKYWASFTSPDTNRNCAYLQPQKTQIRLFTRLDESFAKDLQPTPSSMGWADMYPGIFLIKSESQIERAIELIISSYQNDKRL